MEKNLELMLEGNRFATLSLNQYSKGFNVKCKLLNYTYTEGDTATIEYNINNKLYYIQSTDIIIEEDTVIFRVNREVTLNSGKGYFNVVITNGDVRTSNFKANLEIISNSIDENTVSSAFIVTAKEELDNSISNATNKITELNNLISNTTIEGLNNKVDKEDGKGLSTNDFTNDYKNKIDTSSSNIADLDTKLSRIVDTNAEEPITFNLVCGTSEAIKHNNSDTHNWYIVRNGFCYIQLDLDIVNKDIQTLKIIKNLPQPMFADKEFWDNIVGQGSNVGNSLSFKINTDADTSTGTITVDKASRAGRYMGTIIYPILV